MNRKNPLPWLLIAAGLILIIIASAYIDGNRRQAAQATLTPAGVSQVQRVTLEEAKTAYDSGSAIFVDVRDSSSFSVAHIPGAVLIPLSDLATRLGELDQNAWIIPYCTWFAEESSARAALLLLEHGFTKVTPLLGGFNAWVQAGYPVEASK